MIKTKEILILLSMYLTIIIVNYQIWERISIIYFIIIIGITYKGIIDRLLLFRIYAR